MQRISSLLLAVGMLACTMPATYAERQCPLQSRQVPFIGDDGRLMLREEQYRDLDCLRWANAEVAQAIYRGVDWDYYRQLELEDRIEDLEREQRRAERRARRGC